MTIPELVAAFEVLIAKCDTDEAVDLPEVRRLHWLAMKALKEHEPGEHTTFIRLMCEQLDALLCLVNE